jgi:hypothetical protein
MIHASAYLVKRFAHRAFEFLKDWYIESFRFVGNKTNSILRLFDRVLALVVTLRHFGEPLYQDRTVIGYILGFIFRSIRIAIALVVYTVVILIVCILYLIWLLIPIYIVYMVVWTLLF